MTNEEIIEQLCYVNVKLNETLSAIRKNKNMKYDIENIEYHIEDLEQILFLIVQNIKGAYYNKKKCYLPLKEKTTSDEYVYEYIFYDLIEFFNRKHLSIGLCTPYSLVINDIDSMKLDEGISDVVFRLDKNLMIINYITPKNMQSQKIELNTYTYTHITMLFIKKFAELYCEEIDEIIGWS